jgi:uncharacterized protein (TIGR03067 family)
VNSRSSKAASGNTTNRSPRYRWLRISRIGFALFAATALAANEQDDANKKEMDRMRGEWHLVSMIRNGEELPTSELGKMVRQVAGNEVTVIVEGAEGVATIKSTLQIDATKNPKTIDATRTNGPTKGRAALGIYELDGDELKTCVAPPDKDRPTEFASKPGSEHTLAVWKRVKAEVTPTANKLDPKAVEIIKQVGSVVHKAKSIRVDGTITMSGPALASPVKINTAWSMELPNRLKMRSRLADGEAGVDLICDGKKVFVYSVARNQYTEDDAPHELAEFGQNLMGLGARNAGILFRNLLTDDAAETLMFGVNTCVYAGIEKVDDRTAHYLKFTQDDFNWELWVATEGKPVVLKMRSEFSGDGRPLSIVEAYKNWQIDSDKGDDFTFKPPEGAKKVDRLGQ